MNRYLSHSTAIINDPQQQKSKEYSKKRLVQMNNDERERRNTCTLSGSVLVVPPPPPSSTSTLNSTKDRRLTLSSINWPIPSNQSETVVIHPTNDVSTTTTTTTNNGGIVPPRDTDSSSTQDSGYSESTPYFLIQQTTPDTEQIPTVSNTSKVFKHFFLLSLT